MARQPAPDTGSWLPSVRSLEELTALVADHPRLYVRWSDDPEGDTRRQRSRDDLTASELPGLSANPLEVEEWWGDRPLELWVARRVYDYLHLRRVRGPDVRPWLLEGDEVGRGPDNEPLVRCDRPVAWVDDAVVDEAVRMIESTPADWGPLDRQGRPASKDGSDDG